MVEKVDVIVKLDDRVRLMSAVLAATHYPEIIQKTKPHGTHAHARATRKFLKDFQDQPAVKSTEALLDAGTSLESLFSLALQLELSSIGSSALPSFAPVGYNEQLQDFYETTGISEFWESEQHLWDKALAESNTVFSDTEFKAFLKPFFGEINYDLVFVPNISYPSSVDLGFQLGDSLICIAPPPLAWGDSAPWPYDEPSMITHSYGASLTAFANTLLENFLDEHAMELVDIVTIDLPLTDEFKERYPSWEDQFSILFLSALVAMYFEGHVAEIEYKSHMLMEKKARGLTNLPGVVSVMRRYLQEVGGGKYDNLIEFLPIFPKQLRVAQRMVTF